MHLTSSVPSATVDAMSDDLSLAAAYALESPDDNRRLYDAWAESYDRDFIEAERYVYPRLVASALAERGGRGPVLDIGCGTGIGGVELGLLGIGPVDGVDISPEMLTVARRKQVGGVSVYRSLVVGDLTAGLAMADGVYASLISVGTFTHGHLGPEVLPEVVRVAMPGAVGVIGVNAEHFADAGFDEVLDRLVDVDMIEPPELLDVPIYRDNTADHGADRALIVRFTRLG